MTVPTRAPFEVVVAEHGATVLRVCLALLGPADADDAWSDTFLAALRAYPSLAADANVEAWLVTIARRKAIDIIRASARRVPTAELPDVAPPGADQPGGTGPGDPAEELVRRIDLVADLGRLPDKQRRAVVYHHLAGLPHAEVAGILGGSADAARRAAADGIAALRRRQHRRPHDPPPTPNREEHP